MALPLAIVVAVGSAAVLGAAPFPGAAEAAAEPSASSRPAGPSAAAPGAPRATRVFRAELALTGTDFRYEEFSDDGSLLDRERGIVPGVSLAGSVRSGGWEVAAALSYQEREVAYEGHTNTGLPITTESTAELSSGAIRVWRWFELRHGSLAPQAGLAYRAWNRAIHPTTTASGRRVAGLDESYTWWTGELGATALLAPLDRLRVGVDARVIRSVAPRLKVEFTTGFDDARLALGERTAFRIGIPAAYAFSASSELRLELHLETWGFGRSGTQELTRGGVRVGTVHEPRSEGRNMGVTFGLSRRW